MVSKLNQSPPAAVPTQLVGVFADSGREGAMEVKLWGAMLLTCLVRDLAG